MKKIVLNYSKYITYISGFYFLAWVIHVLVLSVVAFFHFRLDHKLIIIENWIYDFAWQLALLSKLISFFIYYKFFYESRTKNFSDLIFNIKSFLPQFEVFAVSLTILGFFSYFSHLSFADNVLFTFDRFFIQGGSIFILLFLDFLVIDIFDKDKSPIKTDPKSLIIKVLFTSLVITIYTISIFPFGDNLNSSVFSLFGIAYVFYFLFDRSFINGLCYTAIVLIPLFTLFGFDPVWGQKFSYFTPQIKNLSLYSFSLMGVLLGYYCFFNKKRSS